jgi:aspartate/methionine/tyrosine aminotransferase
MFSSRLPRQLTPNRVSRAAASARRAGVPLLDLTETNPTAVGLSYAADLLSPLADPAGLRYVPDPRGLVAAREVVAAEQRHRACPVDPARVVLTSSTSEAYSLLFKLLCDPGDEVLVPRPSYPLFDLLTALDAVVARPFRLDPDACWAIDRDSVVGSLTGRTRAVLIVSPNNPTGSMLRAHDRDWLRALAAERRLALIADEVFADYPLAPQPDACRWMDGALGGALQPSAPYVPDGAPCVMSFTLGGLSKSIGLPQAKLAWIVVDGPDDLAAAALERIDVIADSYLSVSTPVQIAAPALIERGGATREAIRGRVARNLEALRVAAAAWPPVSLHSPEGGWSAVLRVPAIAPEESLVLRLIEEQHVIVHPGFFFDFPSEAYLVVSLLPDPAVFDEAVGRMLPVAAGAR